MSDEIQYQDKPEGYFEQTQVEVAAFINKKKARILDIGCAGGQTGRWLKDNGYAEEVHGIELVRDAAEIAKNYLDFVTVGNLETLDFQALFEPNYFDYIIATEVLEHLAYPQDTLKKLGTILKPDGRFIASVPNMRHIRVLWHLLAEADWRYRELGPLDYTHLRFFTKKSFKRLFENSNYTVVELSPVLLEKAQTINSVTLGLFKDYLTFRYFCIAQPNR